jgi:hypothetical protein
LDPARSGENIIPTLSSLLFVILQSPHQIDWSPP